MSFFKRLFRRKPKNDKYEMGLHKTKERLGNLKEVLRTSERIDENLFMELEDIFIAADMGVETVLYFVNELRKEVDNQKITDPELLAEIIVDKMFEIYLKGEIVDTDLTYNEGEVDRKSVV